MKNLIDELHKLDEYEYNVSSDFADKVMNNIKKNKTSNKMNCVISLVSVGMVACLAVFMFSNTNIKVSFDNKETENQTYNTGKYDLTVADVMLDNSNIKESNTGANELRQELKAETESANINQLNQEKDVDNSLLKNESNIMESVSGNSLNQIAREEVYDLIENALKAANYRYERVELGFEVRATKDEISKLLKDNSNYIIEEKEGYVLIKIK